jgi:ABC-type multidrug transport system fused ATPase/permease subunit
LIFAARRYVKRAPKGYITEGGTYSQINSTFTETVEGARTVEALGLQRNRIEQGDEDIAVSGQAERYTMTLRNLLFMVIGFAYDTPLPMVLILGGIGSILQVSLGRVTAAATCTCGLEPRMADPPMLRLPSASPRPRGCLASLLFRRIAAGRGLPVGNRLIGGLPIAMIMMC